MYDPDLIGDIRPGMHLCSSDYHKWGEVDEVRPAGSDGAGEPLISGHLETGGSRVHVPASAALEIKDGKCVRLNVPIAELGAKGWDEQAAGLPSER